MKRRNKFYNVGSNLELSGASSGLELGSEHVEHMFGDAALWEGEFGDEDLHAQWQVAQISMSLAQLGRD